LAVGGGLRPLPSGASLWRPMVVPIDVIGQADADLRRFEACDR
jgi:hypothetical protein